MNHSVLVLLPPTQVTQEEDVQATRIRWKKSAKAIFKNLAQKTFNWQAYNIFKPPDPINLGKKSTESSMRHRSEPDKGTYLSFSPHEYYELRHWLENCRRCIKDQKRKLVKELSSQIKDGMKSTTNPHNHKNSSVLLIATSIWKFQATVCASIRSAAALMDGNSLNETQKDEVKGTTVKTDPSRQSDRAINVSDGSQTFITCPHPATITKDLQIRHASAHTTKNFCRLTTLEVDDELPSDLPYSKTLCFYCQKAMKVRAVPFDSSVHVSVVGRKESEFDSELVWRFIDGCHDGEGSYSAVLDFVQGFLDIGPKEPNKDETILQLKLKKPRRKTYSRLAIKN